MLLFHDSVMKIFLRIFKTYISSRQSVPLDSNEYHKHELMSRTLVDVQYMLFSANTSSLDLAIITITRQSQFPKSVSTIKYLLLFGCRNICLKCKNAIIQVPVGQHGRCNKGLYLAPSSMKHHQKNHVRLCTPQPAAQLPK